MKFISTHEAPQPAGHYVQAVVHAGLVYVAGQVPRYPGSDEQCPSSIGDQTRLVLNNLSAILQASGSGIERVLKVTVYLTDLDTWSTVNEVYADFFGAHRPARTTVPVTGLRRGYRIEIDAIAAVDQGPREVSEIAE